MAGGFVGAMVGLFLGIKAVEFFIGIPAGPTRSLGLGWLLAIPLMILGAVAGGIAGGCGYFGESPKAKPFQIPPDVEEAARSYFNSSTPDPGSGDRIKQPDEPGPDTPQG
jgi:hypothetical protein